MARSSSVFSYEQWKNNRNLQSTIREMKCRAIGHPMQKRFLATLQGATTLKEANKILSRYGFKPLYQPIKPMPAPRKRRKRNKPDPKHFECLWDHSHDKVELPKDMIKNLVRDGNVRREFFVPSGIELVRKPVDAYNAATAPARLPRYRARRRAA